MIFQQTNPASLGARRQALLQKLTQQFAQNQKSKQMTPQPGAAPGAQTGGGAGVGSPLGLGAARNSAATPGITQGDNVAAAIASRLGAINPRALMGEYSGSPGGSISHGGQVNPGGGMMVAPGMVGPAHASPGNAPTPVNAPGGGGMAPTGASQIPEPPGFGNPTGGMAGNPSSAMNPSTGIYQDPSGTSLAGQDAKGAAIGNAGGGGANLIPVGNGVFYNPLTGQLSGNVGSLGTSFGAPGKGNNL